MLEPGQRVELSYPRCNTILRISDYQLRRVIVQSVRDLVREPLTPAEFLRRPFVRRSRWMIHATEADTGKWRRFYLGASREFFSPSVLRLGLYAPGESRPRKIVGPEFGNTRGCRRKLIRILRFLASQDLDDLSVRVIATDLRLMAG